MRRTLILTAAMCAIFACDREQPDATSPTTVANATVATAAQTTGTTAAQVPAAATPEGVAEKDVRALFDAWLASQNTSDFDAYSATYADKFEGIKRVGPKKSSYDREGWLKDRKRMFSKKMAVTADETKINTAGNTAIVRFTQTWASGTFKDVGPKQLVVVKTDDGLKVSREEMLSSSVVGADEARPVPYDPSKHAFVESGEFVILQTSDDDVEVGKLTLVSRGGDAMAAVKKAPEELSSMVGQSFVVRGGDSDCEAKIETLHVLARAVPHFGQVGYWEGRETDGRPVADAQVAKEIWEMTDGSGRVLAGKLDKKCDGATWAHAKGQSIANGAVMVGAKAHKQIADRAVEAMRGLAGYREIQKQWRKDSGKSTPWDSAGISEVTAFSTDDGVRYVAVSASAGEGCGDFLGEFWAIFQVNGETLALMTDPKSPGAWFAPKRAVVIDEAPIFSDDKRAAVRAGTVWRVAHDASVPSFDCPC